MTNVEILSSPERRLGAYEAQRLALLRDALVHRDCPVCGNPMNKFEAGRIQINDYSFNGEERYACARGEVPLEAAVPLVRIGPCSWFWRRDFARPWPRDPVNAAP